MKLEVGKKYLDREGAEIHIIGTDTDKKYPFVGLDADQTRVSFTADGHYTTATCVYDLVAEAPAPTECRAAKSPLPDDSTERKAIPVWEGVVAYFPAALVAAARISKLGNDKHNPGEPLHHARGKSMDHTDCIARHLIDYQAIKAAAGGQWATCQNATVAEEHLGNLVWRVLAYAQEQLEEMGRAPLPPRARLATAPKGDEMTTQQDTADTADPAEGLCDFEIIVLKGIAGVGPSQPWGAAVGVCLEFLQGARLIHQVDGVIRTTAKGQQLAERLSE